MRNLSRMAHIPRLRHEMLMIFCLRYSICCECRKMVGKR